MPNTTLKSTAHSDYDADYSWWDRTTGVLRLNQAFTADAPLSHPTADPGYTLYAVFNAAVDNTYVRASADTRIGVGIYAKQSGLPSGDWDWLYGVHTVSADVSGTVGTPTVRYYLVHTQTSRGFSIISVMTTESAAPSDTDFTGGASVFLSWARPLQFGVTGYDVYRWDQLDTFTDTDVNTGTDKITLTGHTLANDDKITLIAGAGALPSPLVENLTYYVVNAGVNDIQLSLTEGGAAIDLTTTGAAVTHSVAGNGVKLRTIETGLSSMRDNNSTIATDIVFPSFDYVGLRAFTATARNVISALAVNGVSSGWDTLPFAIKIPANFNKGSMNDTQINQQWIRIKLFGADATTNRLDYRVTDVVSGVGGSLYYTSPGGGFTADLVGLTCTVSSKFGTFDALVSGYTDPTEILLGIGGEWNGSDNYTGGITMTFTGGAPSGAIHIDLAHLSYGPNAVFAFHPDDLSQDRGTPPVAPNGSTQGGTTVVTGNGDGTIFGNQCVDVHEMVTVTDGAGAIFQIEAGEVEAEHYLFNHDKRITQTTAIAYSSAMIYRMETENGFYADTSDTHKYLTAPDDMHGTPLRAMSEGDAVLTSVDGESVMTTVSRIYPIGQGVVAQFELPQDRRFLCGRWNDGVCRKWGGIASHNKREDPDIIIVS